MTDKHIGGPMGRMEEADAASSAAKRLENEGRADRARGAANNAVHEVGDKLTGRKPTKRWRPPMREPTQTGTGR